MPRCSKSTGQLGRRRAGKLLARAQQCMDAILVRYVDYTTKIVLGCCYQFSTYNAPQLEVGSPAVPLSAAGWMPAGGFKNYGRLWTLECCAPDEYHGPALQRPESYAATSGTSSTTNPINRQLQGDEQERASTTSGILFSCNKSPVINNGYTQGKKKRLQPRRKTVQRENGDTRKEEAGGRVEGVDEKASVVRRR